jgi:uncharacterized membrane protein
VGRGWKRIAVNTVLLVAVIMSLVSAFIIIKGGVKKLQKSSKPAPVLPQAKKTPE